MAIRALLPAAKVEQVPCPLLVPLVEEGWFDHEATRIIAAEYLAPLIRDGLDTLVLGCTHYPLLKPLLHRILGPEVFLIDSAEETAKAVANQLVELDLEAPDTRVGSHRFVVSDDQARFLEVGGRFVGEKLKDVETVPLG
jgi:glutamate racemase